MIATIDFETTGLKAGEDEVLQVSIIDENYNVLLNVYCRPNNKGSWEDAQAVHGITPLMVANELPFERYVPTVLDILNRRNTERLNRIIQRGLRKYLKCTQTQIFLQDLINS